MLIESAERSRLHMSADENNSMWSCCFAFQEIRTQTGPEGVVELTGRQRQKQGRRVFTGRFVSLLSRFVC